MSETSSGGAGQTWRPSGRIIIVTGATSCATMSTCGGRKLVGHQARRRSRLDGSRASTACSRAPTRLPDGIAVAALGDHRELADLEQHRVGGRAAAFFDDEELDRAVAGPAARGEQPLLGDGVADVVGVARQREPVPGACVAFISTRAAEVAEVAGPHGNHGRAQARSGPDRQRDLVDRESAEAEMFVVARVDFREQQREAEPLGRGRRPASGAAACRRGRGRARPPA